MSFLDAFRRAHQHGAGSDLFYYGDWIRKPGVAIVSCNDGLRPVIMKLEATDIDANLQELSEYIGHEV